MTPDEIREGITRLAAEASGLRSDMDRTARSPFEQRAVEARLGAAEGRYTSCWAAWQRLENVDPRLADLESFAAALRAVEADLAVEKAQAMGQREHEPDESLQRGLTQTIAEIDFMRDVVRRGPTATGSLSGVPGPLTARLTGRGVFTLLGGVHVFERRGGLLVIERTIEDLRREREAAMAVLVRELMQPVAAG